MCLIQYNDQLKKKKKRIELCFLNWYYIFTLVSSMQIMANAGTIAILKKLQHKNITI